MGLDYWQPSAKKMELARKKDPGPRILTVVRTDFIAKSNIQNPRSVIMK